ncbi:MAG: hypothetical protein IJ405_08955 [Lachnospiraceae bacterium]|nr:hypothetical protein [Lachnospiraceae bacterium]
MAIKMKFFKKHNILTDVVLLMLLGILLFTNVKSLLDLKAYGVEHVTEQAEAMITEYQSVKGLVGKEHYAPVMELTIGASVYTRDSLVAFSEMGEVGQSVEVSYDASNPVAFYTEAEIKYVEEKIEAQNTRVFLFGGVFLIMIIILIGDIKKKVQGGKE